MQARSIQEQHLTGESYQNIPTGGDAMDIDEQNIITTAYDAEAKLIKSKSPHLPISKVKKISRCDPEYIITSNAAFVATSFATEIFIKSLTEETLVMSQLNNSNTNKQVKRLTYDDLAKCIARDEKFQFLGDVIPTTKNLKVLVKDNKVRYSNPVIPDNKQSTLPFMSIKDGWTNQQGIMEETDDINEELQEEDDDDNDDDDEEEVEEEDDDEDEEEDELILEEQRKLQEQLDDVEKLNHVEDLDKQEIDNQVEKIDIDSDATDE